MSRAPLLEVTAQGLWCAAAGLHVDPWGPAERAVVTHAHGDHARRGTRHVLAAAPGLALLRTRLGRKASIEAVPYGQAIDCNGVRVSLHPAGHVLGSAQVRLERGGEVWVVSGDYKRAPDPTCAPFEPLACHVFVTESTFARPEFVWPAPDVVADAIRAWWRTNAAAGHASVLYAYALGKAQRVLALLGARATNGPPAIVHGAIDTVNRAYRASGVDLPPAVHASAVPRGTPLAEALVLAPPSAACTGWARRFGPHRTALASGWAGGAAPRPRRGIERGFVLSDHADWPALVDTIAETGAGRVLVTHGHYAAEFARWLAQNGRPAEVLEARGHVAEAPVATPRGTALT